MKNTINDSTPKNAKIVTRSLKMKYGCIDSLSELDSTPRGLLLPLVCSVTRCIIARAARINGRTKCRLKNRFRVALLTLNPPHTNSTKSCPIQGIADSILVITVAAHSDICP